MLPRLNFAPPLTIRVELPKHRLCALSIPKIELHQSVSHTRVRETENVEPLAMGIGGRGKGSTDGRAQDAGCSCDIGLVSVSWLWFMYLDLTCD